MNTTPQQIATTTTREPIDLDAMLDEANRAMQRVSAAGQDTRALKAHEKENILAGLAKALGLNPLSNPVRFLPMQGGEVLYVTRQGTDQIAARLRLNRETVVGPEVRDVGGTKLVFCQVRVTAPAPDGRSEMATATLPLKDISNDLMKCECVPLDSEILTRRGFKRHDEVRIGEEVLAYDATNNRSEWVPLENVTTYPSAPVATFATARGGFSFRCTPNHSWAVETNTRAGRQLVEAQAVKTHHHLRIAAAAEGGDHPLSPDLAAVLGWVMCDGTIRRVGNNLRLVIYQSKVDRVPEIRELLARAGLAYQEGVGEATVRTFPGGATHDCLPQHSFRLTTAASKSLFDDAGIEGPADMPRLVGRLSADARREMLKAMMAADGTANGTFGKKRKPGVMEAWQILCTLEGVALGKMGTSSVGEVPVQRMLSYDYVAGNNLTLTPDGEEPVWCPTTKHGTWVMRQGGRITITGNTKAKRRATLSLAGLGLLTEEETETIPGARVEAQRDDAPAQNAPVDALAAFRADLDAAEGLTLDGARTIYARHDLGGTSLSAVTAVLCAALAARGYRLTATEAGQLLRAEMPDALALAYDRLAAVDRHADDEDGDGVVADVVRVLRGAGSLAKAAKARLLKVGAQTIAALLSLDDATAAARLDAALRPPQPPTTPTGTDAPRAAAPSAEGGAVAPAATAGAQASVRTVLDTDSAHVQVAGTWRETEAGWREHLAEMTVRRRVEASVGCNGALLGPRFLALAAERIVELDAARPLPAGVARLTVLGVTQTLERVALDASRARAAAARGERAAA